MRSRRRLIVIPMLAIFFVIGMAFSASALVEVDYDDTWWKIKFQITATCVDVADALSSEKAKDTAWIYITAWDTVDRFDGFLVTQMENGDWQATAIELVPGVGTPDDSTLEILSPDIVDGGDTVTIDFLLVRLIGKENKDGDLSKGKIEEIAGVASLDINSGEFDCTGTLGIGKGKFKKNGPPQKVLDDTGL